MSKETKEIFILVILSKTLELDLKEDNFSEFFVQQKRACWWEPDRIRGPAKEESQEKEVTQEPKRFTGNEKGIFFLLLVYEVQDLNIEQYTKVSADIQNTSVWYRVI